MLDLPLQDTSEPDLNLIDLRKQKFALMLAIEKNRSRKWTLRLWSRFIKARDSHSCVPCGSTKQIQAHHIVRRTLYPWGSFQTGNGITLCLECHNRVHKVSNGKADLSQSIGDGDDQDEWSFLFGALREDAKSQGLDQDEFYYIDDHMMDFFVKIQGYERLRQMVFQGKISRLLFAQEIMRGMPEIVYTKLLSSMFGSR